MIVFIFLYLLILYIELRAIKIRRSKIKSSGKLIEIYKHAKKKKVFYYILSVLTIIIFLLKTVQFSGNIILESLELVLVFIFIMVFFHNYLTNIYIYENAIVINGRYIPWNHIESVKERKLNGIIIKVKKESDTSYLEIKSRGINEVHKLKTYITKSIQE